MILCCGEALIDMITETNSSGKTRFSPHTGGAVFNTAIGLGRLGAPVALLSGVSTDEFGTQLVEELTRSKVSTMALIRSDRPSTLAFAFLTDGQARYRFYDENSAGRMITQSDVPALPNATKAMFFGGISLCAKPAADTYAAQCADHAETHLIMLDPNIRPSFIGDESRYRARLGHMIAHSDIVKLSDEDLGWLVTSGATTQDKAQHILSQGPKLVLITKGANGATAYHKSGWETSVSGHPAKVVDTVGAGDSFNAAVLAKLNSLGLLHKVAVAKLDAHQAQNVLNFAARVAAITVSRAGANPPWAEEM